MFEDFGSWFGDAAGEVIDEMPEQLGDSSLFDTGADLGMSDSFFDENMFGVGDVATVDAQPNFFDQLGDYAKTLYSAVPKTAISSAAGPALSNLFTTAVQKYTNLSGSQATAQKKSAANTQQSKNNTMLLVAGAVLILFFAMKKGRM